MTSEADRHDLYTGLIEVLGPKRAGTLMAVLPAVDISQLVTKEEFRAGLAELRAEMSGLRSEFKSDLHQILLALIGGLIVILGAMIGLAFLP